MGSKERSIKKISVKQRMARAGEIWSINDAETRGHKSILTKIKRKNDTVDHIPTTHSPKTKKMKNIQLQKNLNINDNSDAYILPKLKNTHLSNLGKKYNNFKMSNPIDKSIVRHIKKQKNKKR